MIRPKVLSIIGEGFSSRLVADIMISRNRIHGNRRINLRGNAQVFRGLCSVANLIDEVTANDHKSRMDPIDVGDSKLVLNGFLCEIPV